jgi:hypothetical protein
VLEFEIKIPLGCAATIAGDNHDMRIQAVSKMHKFCVVKETQVTYFSGVEQLSSAIRRGFFLCGRLSICTTHLEILQYQQVSPLENSRAL